MRQNKMQALLIFVFVLSLSVLIFQRFELAIGVDHQEVAQDRPMASKNDIAIPELPDRSANPLLEAANFHIFTEEFNHNHGNAHTAGNVATNFLNSNAPFGNEYRPTDWQRTSYVRTFSNSLNGNHLKAWATIYGLDHVLSGNGNQRQVTNPEGIRMNYEFNADRQQGAAINDDYVTITATLAQLYEQSKSYQNHEAVDFFNSPYVTETNGDVILDLTGVDADPNGVFYLNITQADFLSNRFQNKGLIIKSNSTQQLIFNVLPNPPVNGVVHIGKETNMRTKVFVDGIEIVPDPENKGTYYPGNPILWNIIPVQDDPENKLVYNLQHKFFGAILAPTLRLRATAAFEGNLIAKIYEGSGAETHSWTYHPKAIGQLWVAKNVSSQDPADQDKLFEFKVTLDRPLTAAFKVSGQHNLENNRLAFKDGVATFTLKHGQHIVIDLPEEINAQVQETNGQDFETTINGDVHPENQSNKIPIIKHETQQLLFQNNKGTVPETVDVPVQKHWADRDNHWQLRQDVTLQLQQQVGPDSPWVDVPDHSVTFKKDATNWNHVFQGLPKVIDGQPVSYRVTENRLPGYADPAYDPASTDHGSQLGVTNQLLTTAIQFTKHFSGRADTGKQATFTLYRHNPGSDQYEQVAHHMTDIENGTISFKNLPVGKYRLKETQRPAGYQAIADYDFDIQDVEGQLVITPDFADKVFDNMLKDFELLLTKKDEYDNKLTGASFKLTGPDDYEVIITSTAAHPLSEFKFEGLKPGKYTLTELKTPGNYLGLSEPVTIQINDQGQVQIEHGAVSQLQVVLGKGQQANQISFDLENREKHALPVTGGQVRHIITASALAMAIMSGCYLGLRYLKNRKGGG
ncbi:MAG: Cna B-type domain-containing protein [Lactobacillus sp.]|jgi:hypothetical protein|nr:Cna B-type domain-containing protein [Lactobacillus sp.]